MLRSRRNNTDLPSFSSLFFRSSDPMKESAFPGWIIYADKTKTRGQKPEIIYKKLSEKSPFGVLPYFIGENRGRLVGCERKKHL